MYDMYCRNNFSICKLPEEINNSTNRTQKLQDGSLAAARRKSPPNECTETILSVLCAPYIAMEMH